MDLDVTKDEVIEVFTHNIYQELVSGYSFEPLKFIFNDDDLYLFDEVKNNPYFLKNKESLASITSKIEFIKDNNYAKENEFVVNVNDANLFFEKLTDLINLYAKKTHMYGGFSNSKRFILNNYLSDGLWLKMTPYDFNDIYGFLDRQMNFINNNSIFKKYDPYLRRDFSDNVVSKYMDYEIIAKMEDNNFWFETLFHMAFELIDKENKTTYNLPVVHYGIDNNKVCYIYAVQNIYKEQKDKKIERNLYKLNKGITNPLNHPSFVLSLHTFIEMLKSHDIYDIKVPLLEVISHSFHQRIGERSREIYERRWKDKNINSLDDIEMEQYLEDRNDFDKFTDKEDFISEAKIDGLTNLFLRVEEQFDDIKIDVEQYQLSIKIKEKHNIKNR